MTTCPKSGMLLKSAGLTLHPWMLNKFVRLKMQMLGITVKEKAPMNLALLQRPKRIKPGTKTMYVYHPSVVTTNTKLEPGDVLKILDVFEGATTSETTLKVMKAQDWEDHRWGRSNMFACEAGADYPAKNKLCDCEKELSEMSEEFRVNVHYVLLSDVGK